ncbi:hypothetical protein [Flavobacterium cellulosilyticum]|uniref:hypothetical protein n=1 Tax=Flavobacterium cellulosilyticum TaxID=2541731 RepID=UPI0014048BEF|nr:hypothetical protein [Flavobacterium cellulosilyticum]
MTFYTTLADANNLNAIPITSPAAFQNHTPFNDNVWIRVANNTIPSSCFDIVELKLVVNQLPVVQLKPEYFITKYTPI